MGNIGSRSWQYGSSAQSRASDDSKSFVARQSSLKPTTTPAIDLLPAPAVCFSFDQRFFFFFCLLHHFFR